MKPIQWLLIGGEGHGKTLWIAQGSRVSYPCKHSYDTQLYDGQNYLNDGKLYRIGLHNATQEQRAEIPTLIMETRLSPIGD